MNTLATLIFPNLVNRPSNSTDEKIICPLCGDDVEKLVYRFHYESEQHVINKIKENNPSWSEKDGACSRCIDYYHVKLEQEDGLIPEAGSHFKVNAADDFVIIPTPLRLDANATFTGKGVTICFIDSGFTLHPDLVKNKNRIKKIVDITHPKRPLSYFKNAHNNSWHGTMTSVVCAGDGFLSKGLYKGIASDAELVLLKVMDDKGKISTENIAKALKWVLRNHKKYNIRIVNMSLGDDEPTSYKTSVVDQLAEKVIAAGISIVAAVGNDVASSIKPPANALHVIAIGGIDDENKLGNDQQQLYHSSFGKTIDDLSKPELIANSIWIAAPMPRATDDQEEAKILYDWLALNDDELLTALRKKIIFTKLGKELIHTTDATIIRNAIISRIQQAKYISSDYMHVDGTSFAAPIVCSVLAQLLEANPSLTPLQIREALFNTAKKLPAFAVERQGFGIIQPREALLKVLNHDFGKTHPSSPYIDKKSDVVEFFIRDYAARGISLVGSFNNWQKDALLLKPFEKGLWKIEFPLPSPGDYLYKFLVNGTEWRADTDNPFREPDGYGGWNSVLRIEG